MGARGPGGTAHRGRPATPRRSGASLPLRGVWFLLVGWWLGLLWLAVAWTALVSVVGAPVGRKMVDALPGVRSLSEAHLLPPATGRRPPREQEPLLVRAVYFLLVGWWLSAASAAIGYALTLTVVATPLGDAMLRRVPFVASLYRC